MFWYSVPQEELLLFQFELKNSNGTVFKEQKPQSKNAEFYYEVFSRVCRLSFNTFVIDELEHNFNPFTELFYGVDVGSR